MHTSTNEKGLSLVEVMVGMFLFGIVMMGFSGLATNVIIANRMSSKITAATNLAQKQIEHIKGVDYSALQTQESVEDYGDIPGFGEFKRVTSVSCNAGTGTCAKNVTVTILWRNDTRHLTLETVKAL